MKYSFCALSRHTYSHGSPCTWWSRTSGGRENSSDHHESRLVTRPESRARSSGNCGDVFPCARGVWAGARQNTGPSRHPHVLSRVPTYRPQAVPAWWCPLTAQHAGGTRRVTSLPKVCNHTNMLQGVMSQMSPRLAPCVSFPGVFIRRLETRPSSLRAPRGHPALWASGVGG